MKNQLYSIKFKHTENAIKKLSKGQVYTLNIRKGVDLKYDYKVRVKGEADVP